MRTECFVIVCLSLVTAETTRFILVAFMHRADETGERWYSLRGAVWKGPAHVVCKSKKYKKNITSAEEPVMFSGLSVCLLVCPLDYSKSCERILKKFSGGIGWSKDSSDRILVGFGSQDSQPGFGSGLRSGCDVIRIQK